MADFVHKAGPVFLDALVPNTLTTPAAGIDLDGRTLVGVVIPAGLEGTTLGFTVSETLGGTYRTLMSGGTAVSITVAADRYVALDPNMFAGVRYVKPVVGAQTGDITLKLVVRR